MSAVLDSLLHLKTENYKIFNRIILFLCTPKIESLKSRVMGEFIRRQIRHLFSNQNV